MEINQKLCIWIRTRSSAQQLIFQKYQNGGAFPGYGFRITSGLIGFWSDAIGSWQDSNGSVNNGNFHHVAVIGNGSSGKLYIDDVLDKSFAYAAPSSNNAEVGYIRALEGEESFWSGVIDDVHVYNRALPPDEIKRLYNMGR